MSQRTAAWAAAQSSTSSDAADPRGLVVRSAPSFNSRVNHHLLNSFRKSKQDFMVSKHTNDTLISRADLADTFENTSWIVRTIVDSHRSQPVDEAVWGDALPSNHLGAEQATSFSVDTTRQTPTGRPRDLDLPLRNDTDGRVEVNCDILAYPNFSFMWDAFPGTLEAFQQFVAASGDPLTLTLTPQRIYTQVWRDQPDQVRIRDFESEITSQSQKSSKGSEWVTITHRDGDGFTSRPLPLGHAEVTLSFGGDDEWRRFDSRGMLPIGWRLHIVPESKVRQRNVIDRTTDVIDAAASRVGRIVGGISDGVLDLASKTVDSVIEKADRQHHW